MYGMYGELVLAPSRMTKMAIAAFIDRQYDSKKDGMTATLAPISAVVDTYSSGLREHAVEVLRMRCTGEGDG